MVEDQEFAESKAAADRYSGGQDAAPAPAYNGQAPVYTAPAPAQAVHAPETGNADGDFINIPEGLDEELPFK